ncbi:UDP-N-acetylmuramoyl-tripeptide--D-alanyl-D-alanine ligase [Stratiformator vulcanicus]|uniref:UDP-N-acetylmuramoyl-tripeptide--D-alanyl-D-alanine ligase n=1 Tax=Stratiformator vulcanicus TaxID=2527980 RepID=A0A517R2U0_9PLAN|nr:UDP-N-acetylmuramoyl-tripeptide--D-alanyl-D-alanine ligase [Stratiformator vulcanicus]QDT38188.1 UDP-N-acetylmuramoyl-tripeptide--D-alanyl-D-alanine ligase MurF [Stratiformator vulcanicus]
MEPVTLQDVAQATGGVLVPGSAASIEFSGVALDSKEVRIGEIFWAIRGERFDGHDFVHEAIANGARAIVAEDLSFGFCSVPVLIVQHSRSALADFAGWYRRLIDAVVIGVTGSVGKTTTRELIHAALSVKQSGTRSPQNFNNLLGVSRTLLSISKRHRHAVVEMATSSPREISTLSEIVSPDIGVVTSIGEAHIRGLKSVTGVAEEKGDLLRSLPKHGVAFVPSTAPAFDRLTADVEAELITIGSNPSADVVARLVKFDGERLIANIEGSEVRIKVAGPHMLSDVATAYCVAKRFGLSDEEINHGFDSFTPLSGRGLTIRRKPWTVVDDTYNANPTSVRGAIDGLIARPCAGRRILVIGDMLDLGEASTVGHESIGQYAKDQGLDVLIGCGRYAGHFAHGWRQAGMDAQCPVFVCDSASEVFDVLRDELTPGDVVWIKGSRETRMERVVEWLDDFNPAVTLPLDTPHSAPARTAA